MADDHSTELQLNHTDNNTTNTNNTSTTSTTKNKSCYFNQPYIREELTSKDDTRIQQIHKNIHKLFEDILSPSALKIIGATAFVNCNVDKLTSIINLQNQLELNIDKLNYRFEISSNDYAIIKTFIQTYSPKHENDAIINNLTKFTSCTSIESFTVTYSYACHLTQNSTCKKCRYGNNYKKCSHNPNINKNNQPPKNNINTPPINEIANSNRNNNPLQNSGSKATLNEPLETNNQSQNNNEISHKSDSSNNNNGKNSLSMSNPTDPTIVPQKPLQSQPNKPSAPTPNTINTRRSSNALTTQPVNTAILADIIFPNQLPIGILGIYAPASNNTIKKNSYATSLQTLLHNHSTNPIPNQSQHVSIIAGDFNCIHNDNSLLDDIIQSYTYQHHLIDQGEFKNLIHMATD
ncbi:hypothetical protein ACTFIT_008171 [Dictyostelium discoideum]